MFASLQGGLLRSQSGAVNDRGGATVCVVVAGRPEALVVVGWDAVDALVVMGAVVVVAVEVDAAVVVAETSVLVGWTVACAGPALDTPAGAAFAAGGDTEVPATVGAGAGAAGTVRDLDLSAVLLGLAVSVVVAGDDSVTVGEVKGSVTVSEVVVVVPASNPASNWRPPPPDPSVQPTANTDAAARNPT